MLRRSAAIGLAMLFGLFGASQATAATTVGSDLTGTANFGLGCTPETQPTSDCTFGIESLSPETRAPGGAVVSSSGVIVRWRLRHAGVYFNSGPPGHSAPVSVRLRVVRGAGGASVGAGVGIAENLPNPAGTYEFSARLPVRAGDRVGYDLTLPGNVGIYGGAPTAENADLMRTWVPSLPQGSGGVNTAPLAQTALLMNVDIEPDADGDGFGDETQDQCPSDATTSGPCPISSPNTTITKGPKDRTPRHAAKFKFLSDKPGSTFECRLKGKGLKPLAKRFSGCSSPRSYRKLDHGRYVFAVRAVDAEGNIDPTPATHRFKVVR